MSVKKKVVIASAAFVLAGSSASASSEKQGKEDKEQSPIETTVSPVDGINANTFDATDMIRQLRQGIAARNLSDKDTSAVATINSEKMVQCDVKELIEQRANWICEQIVPAASKRLYDIRHCPSKTEYVKSMFQRLGRGRIYASYCLATVQNIWRDVAENTGNLANALPKTLITNDFLRALRQMGYSDCIKKNPKISDVHPGDLIFQSGHVTTAEKMEDGKIHVISFNNDKRYAISGSFESVDMRKLCAKLLAKEMNNVFQDEGLIKAAKDGGLMYVSAEAFQWLTKGMPKQDASKQIQFANKPVPQYEG